MQQSFMMVGWRAEFNVLVNLECYLPTMLRSSNHAHLPRPFGSISQLGGYRAAHASVEHRYAQERHSPNQ